MLSPQSVRERFWVYEHKFTVEAGSRKLLSYSNFFRWKREIVMLLNTQNVLFLLICDIKLQLQYTEFALNSCVIWCSPLCFSHSPLIGQWCYLRYQIQYNNQQLKYHLQKGDQYLLQNKKWVKVSWHKRISNFNVWIRYLLG